VTGNLRAAFAADVPACALPFVADLLAFSSRSASFHSVSLRRGGRCTSPTLATKDPTDRLAYHLSHFVPAAQPTSTTSAVAIEYQVATNNGLSSGQCEA